MELLLNLLWLMLALAAVAVLRHQPSSVRNSEGLGHLRFFLLLGCVLALLFPVVSATDDLHPINQEMEEFSASKRIVKPAPTAKVPLGGPHRTPAVQPACVLLFTPDHASRGSALEHLRVLPKPAPASPINYRGPPAS